MIRRPRVPRSRGVSRAAALEAAGVLARDSTVDAPTLAPPLCAPGGLLLVFRDKRGPFEIVTADGCLSASTLPVLAALRDTRVLKALTKCDMLLVCFSVADAAVLRALQLPSTTADGLDTIEGAGNAQLLKVFKLERPLPVPCFARAWSTKALATYFRGIHIEGLDERLAELDRSVTAPSASSAPAAPAAEAGAPPSAVRETAASTAPVAGDASPEEPAADGSAPRQPAAGRAVADADGDAGDEDDDDDDNDDDKARRRPGQGSSGGADARHLVGRRTRAGGAAALAGVEAAFGELDKAGDINDSRLVMWQPTEGELRYIERRRHAALGQESAPGGPQEPCRVAHVRALGQRAAGASSESGGRRSGRRPGVPAQGA